MKTLVIHPNDYSTHFLSKIYQGTDWTLISDNLTSNKMVVELIKSHDRIIMLGHGDHKGLYARDGKHFRHIISGKHVYLLREKECVCIWCNADVFVKKHNLKGFYTGMFISEMDEAYMYEYYNVQQHTIIESNNSFASIVSKYINNDDRLSLIKNEYSSNKNDITEFNSNRFYENVW